jgi:hypothetical protein
MLSQVQLTPHTSHLTPHTSHLTPHTSHLTPHTSHIFLRLNLLQLVAQRTVDVEVSEEDMRKAFDKVALLLLPIETEFLIFSSHSAA